MMAAGCGIAETGANLDGGCGIPLIFFGNHHIFACVITSHKKLLVARHLLNFPQLIILQDLETFGSRVESDRFITTRGLENRKYAAVVSALNLLDAS